MVAWGHRLFRLWVMKLFRNTVSLMGCWWELKWFGNNNPAKCDYDESDWGGDGCNTAIAITPGVWINEDDGNWNMLIATTRSSDYHPWSACAGHPTNKQTHPVGEKEKKRRRKRINEKTEEIFCFILNLSALILLDTMRGWVCLKRGWAQSFFGLFVWGGF